ncbi:aspartic proteinase NANA, chloroplast-like [Musa acuminata AAA Group]|uniref:aspartic proteinase NANA, chloroplast-like n=1 Tax=Musa acuminata AAA Group TaxID=214697 RepID=UPI0031DDA88F
MSPRVFLLLLVCSHAFLALALGKRSTSIRLKLFRRPASAGSTQLERMQELFRDDQLRQAIIHDRLGRRLHGRRASEVSPPAQSFMMPLNSGVYTGNAQFFVQFFLGKPAQHFVLVADTGSDLTWVKCRLRLPGCRLCNGDGNGTRVFHPEVSSSFQPIPCSSEMCKTSLPFSLIECPSPTMPCSFDYRYGDGSKAQGVFANESATVVLSNGKHTKLRHLVVGCSSDSTGSSFQASDGVLGLGNSNISFATIATARFGGRFSYCLVDHLSPRNASDFLVFGHRPAVLSPPLPSETSLVLGLEPFYAVGVDGISVDGEMLAIPKDVWDLSAGGGTILDSGTSLTVLAQPAYLAVASALNRRLAGIPRVKMDPFEYCYNWTTAPTNAAKNLPRMVVHLAESASLKPPAKTYVINTADGVKCLGIVATPWPGVSVIGNILQQEHLWEFDLKNRRLRFKRSTCGKSTSRIAGDNKLN